MIIDKLKFLTIFIVLAILATYQPVHARNESLLYLEFIAIGDERLIHEIDKMVAPELLQKHTFGAEFYTNFADLSSRADLFHCEPFPIHRYRVHTKNLNLRKEIKHIVRKADGCFSTKPKVLTRLQVMPNQFLVIGSPQEIQKISKKYGSAIAHFRAYPQIACSTSLDDMPRFVHLFEVTGKQSLDKQIKQINRFARNKGLSIVAEPNRVIEIGASVGGINASMFGIASGSSVMDGMTIIPPEPPVYLFGTDQLLGKGIPVAVFDSNPPGSTNPITINGLNVPKHDYVSSSGIVSATPDDDWHAVAVIDQIQQFAPHADGIQLYTVIENGVGTLADVIRASDAHLNAMVATGPEISVMHYSIAADELGGAEDRAFSCIVERAEQANAIITIGGGNAGNDKPIQPLADRNSPHIVSVTAYATEDGAKGRAKYSQKEHKDHTVMDYGAGFVYSLPPASINDVLTHHKQYLWTKTDSGWIAVSGTSFSAAGITGKLLLVIDLAEKLSASPVTVGVVRDALFNGAEFGAIDESGHGIICTDTVLRLMMPAFSTVSLNSSHSCNAEYDLNSETQLVQD